MLPKLIAGVALATGLYAASNVPADLSVDAFTAKTLNHAVQRALGAKPAIEAEKFSLNFGKDKDLRRALGAQARRGAVVVGAENVCAIPLLEVKGGIGHDIDPLAKPTGKTYFDSINMPASVGPCPFRPSLSK